MVICRLFGRNKMLWPSTTERPFLPTTAIVLLLTPVLGCGGPTAETEVAAGLEDLQSLPYLEFGEVDDGRRGGAVLYDSERSQPGINLYCQWRFARLLDMDGHEIHTWRSGTNSSWTRVHLLEDGSLLVVDSDNELARLNWEGEAIWTSPGRYHHDVDVNDSRDRILTVARHRRDIQWGGQTLPILEDVIRELSLETGEVLRDLSVFELVRDRVSETQIDNLTKWAASADLTTTIEQSTPPDLTHVNSVRWLRNTTDHYRQGQVLLSIRNLNSIVILDLDEGRRIWDWGSKILGGQHDATELKPNRVLLFDNYGAGSSTSRILEVRIPDGEILWQYRDEERFWSEIRGSVQRLPNGNTLITSSQDGIVFEITPNGERVWEWVNPRRSSTDRDRRAIVYRMERLTRLPPQL